MKPGDSTKSVHWNTGGWFGAQLGSTIWFLVFGLGVIKQSFSMFILLIICFLIPNSVGTLLWMNRSQFIPYKATQILVFVLFVSTSLALLGADYFEALSILDQRFQNPRNMYWFLLVFPIIMVLLYYLNLKRSNQR